MTTTSTNMRLILALVCTPSLCSCLSWIESSRQECRELHLPSLISSNSRPRLSPNALGESVQPALSMTRKMEKRREIKFCVCIQKLFIEMYSVIQQAFGEEAASCTATYTCWKRFKDERESLDDDEWCGSPATASDVDIFKKSIWICYDIFLNLYRYIDIISIFLKCCYLANLLVVISILTK